jgi:hypothetical protein
MAFVFIYFRTTIDIRARRKTQETNGVATRVVTNIGRIPQEKEIKEAPFN